MGLNQHLKRLRGQPLETRRQVAFTAALIISGLILLFWLGSLGIKLSVPEESLAGAEAAPSPFGVLREELSRIFQQISKGWQQVRGAIK